MLYPITPIYIEAVDYELRSIVPKHWRVSFEMSSFVVRFDKLEELTEERREHFVSFLSYSDFSYSSEIVKMLPDGSREVFVLYSRGTRQAFEVRFVHTSGDCIMALEERDVV